MTHSQVIDGSSYHEGIAEVESSAAGIGHDDSLRKRGLEEAEVPEGTNEEDQVQQVSIEDSSTGASVLQAIEQVESLGATRDFQAKTEDDVNAWTHSNIAVLNELLSKRNQTLFKTKEAPDAVKAFRTGNSTFKMKHLQTIDAVTIHQQTVHKLSPKNQSPRQKASPMQLSKA